MPNTILTLTLSPSETYINNGSAASGGAGYDDRFTVGGSYAPGDTISITLTNTLTGLQTQIGAGYVTGVTPTYVMTFDNKVYALSGTAFYFSATEAPLTWNDPTASGNGFIAVSNYFAGAEVLQAMAPYQGRMAFITRRDVQIWSVDPDPANYVLVQTLPNIGTYAPASVRAVGDMDIYMLYDSGFRSVRVRDASNNAIISDVGTPVDKIIQALAVAPGACAEVDPSANRYMCFVPDATDPDNGVGKIFNFSYFPGSEVAAWATYSPTVDLPSALVLAASAASASQINLVWGGAVSDLGALTYSLYRSTLSGFFPSAATLVASGLTGVTYADTGRSAATTYYYYVIGTDPIGNQILSNEANATTPSSGGGVPGSFVLTATPVSNVEIDLSWTTPSGSGITYDIYRSTNPAFTPDVSGGTNRIVTGQSGTTYNDTGVGGPAGAFGVTYYYYVYANNVSGGSTSNEAFSGVVSLNSGETFLTATFTSTSNDSTILVTVVSTQISATVGVNMFDCKYSHAFSGAKSVVVSKLSGPVLDPAFFVVYNNSTTGFTFNTGELTPAGTYTFSITVT